MSDPLVSSLPPEVPGAVVGIDLGATAWRSAVAFTGSRLDEKPPRRLPDRAPALVVAGPAAVASTLRAVRADAAQLLGEPVPGAVLAVRGAIGMRPRAAIREGTTLAGFAAYRLVDATVAAAVAHARETGSSGPLLVCCLGAGPCEAAIVEVGPHGVRQLVVGEEPALSGQIVDQSIAGLLADRLALSLRAGQGGAALEDGLLAAARRLKLGLSSHGAASTPLTELQAAGIVGQDHPEARLTRGELESVLETPAARLVARIERLLTEASLRPTDLADVVLTGGSSRIPLIGRVLDEALGQPPSVKPDGIVASGAALLGGTLTLPAAPAAAPRAAPPPGAAGQAESTVSRDAAHLEAVSLQQAARRAAAARQLAESVGLLERARTLAHDDDSIREDLEALYQRLAEQLLRQQDERGIRWLMGRLTEHRISGPWARPVHAAGHIFEARRLDRTNHPKEALDAFAEAIKWDPDNQQVRREAVALCLRWSEDGNPARKAMPLLEQGLGIAADDPRLLQRYDQVQARLDKKSQPKVKPKLRPKSNPRGRR